MIDIMRSLTFQLRCASWVGAVRGELKWFPSGNTLMLLTGLLFLATSNYPAVGATVIVPGNANIFGAGHAAPPTLPSGDAGILPPSISLGSGDIFTFSATGSITYNGGGTYYGAEGGGGGGGTHYDSIGGISGIEHGTQFMFLIGVFTDGTEPSGSGPSIVDFSLDSFDTVSPQLNQTFFIGDGLTGTGTGSVQNFDVPLGATRLFLGFADRPYIDNIGTLTVTANQVPEPSKACLLCLALIGFVMRRERRDV